MKITELFQLDTGEYRFNIERETDEFGGIPPATEPETTSYCTDTNGEGIWEKDDKGWRQITGTGQFKLIGIGIKGKKAIAREFGFDLKTGEEL